MNTLLKQYFFFPAAIIIQAILLSSCTRNSTEVHTFEIENFKTRGPIEVESPSSETKPSPLILVLHGYRANALIQKTYFRLASLLTQDRPFHLAYLDGSKDKEGDRFWNASPSCCNFSQSSVDDVAYLSAVIENLKTKLAVSKVYLIGHSNGGFMAYRMLCERSDLIDGVASIAGMNSPLCAIKNFQHSMRIIHIHGTEDTVIPENGGSFRGLPEFPSMTRMMADFGKKLECMPDVKSVLSETKDYSDAISGSDSVVSTHSCKNENRLVAIRILGGSHTPLLNENFRKDLLELLLH